MQSCWALSTQSRFSPTRYGMHHGQQRCLKIHHPLPHVDVKQKLCPSTLSILSTPFHGRVPLALHGSLRMPTITHVMVLIAHVHVWHVHHRVPTHGQQTMPAAAHLFTTRPSAALHSSLLSWTLCRRKDAAPARGGACEWMLSLVRLLRVVKDWDSGSASLHATRTARVAMPDTFVAILPCAQHCRSATVQPARTQLAACHVML